jgi:lipopolysaccharide assembly outer membrane protein LptD (OstA)
VKFKLFILTLFLLIPFASILYATPLIKADHQYFDVNTGLYVLNGNVYIEVQNRIITASQAKVSMGTLEAWASGAVSITQDDITFTGCNVYVFGMQNHATIDGGVNFSRNGLTISSDSVDYSWNTKIAKFSGNVKIVQNSLIKSADNVQYKVQTNCFL